MSSETPHTLNILRCHSVIKGVTRKVNQGRSGHVMAGQQSPDGPSVLTPQAPLRQRDVSRRPPLEVAELRGIVTE